MSDNPIDAIAAPIAERIAALLLPLLAKHERLLTYHEVAERLGIAESQARALGKSGRHWRESRVEGSVRVREEDLDAYVRGLPVKNPRRLA